jgi:hypothetical protein
MVDKNGGVVCCLLATSTKYYPKRENKTQNVEKKVVFEKEYIVRCSSAE